MKKVTLAVAAALAMATAIPAHAGSYGATEDDDVIIPIVAGSSIGTGAIVAGVVALIAIAASSSSSDGTDS